MAKTGILTKDGLVRYDENIKDYIKELTDDVVYVDQNESSTDLPDIGSVTSAKLVSYSNAESGIEATNVQDAIDEVENEVDTLNSKINNLTTRAYSLITPNVNGEITTTETTYTTYDNRKISDYGMILISIGTSTSNANSTTLVPVTIFKQSGYKFYLDCWTNNGQVYNQVCVKYVSDTQVSAYMVTTSTTTKFLNVYGIKIDSI